MVPLSAGQGTRQRELRVQQGSLGQNKPLALGMCPCLCLPGLSWVGSGHLHGGGRLGSSLLCLSSASHMSLRAGAGRCRERTARDRTVQRGAFQSACSRLRGRSVGRAEILSPGGAQERPRTDPCCQPFHSTVSGKITRLPSPRSNGQSSGEQPSGAEVRPSEPRFPMPKSKGAGSREGKQRQEQGWVRPAD